MVKRMVVLLVVLLSATGVQAKSLYWSKVAVEAQLDGDGLLHVVETQTYVLDGDWNGGERTFVIRAGQSLHLEGVDRIEAGQLIPLQRGGIEAVDHYELSDDTKLRWRSRLPEEPEFANKELTYRLRYTLGGVLRGRGNQYRFDHDFCFPDRPDVIKRFSLHFTIAPQWSGLATPQDIVQDNLEPGRSVIVRGALEYHGTTPPRDVRRLGAPWVGYVALLLLLAGLAELIRRFYNQEQQVGRFAKLIPLAEIDIGWLEREVLSLPPEVVGGAWDGKVGAAEVAAILAVLVSEKQLETRVEPRFLRKPKLVMRLLVDRTTIPDYRGKVVSKLFYDGKSETNTVAIQKHYKDRGLDLAALIRGPIEKRIEQLPKLEIKMQASPINWQRNLLAAVIAFALLVAAGVLGNANDGELASMEGLFGFCSLAVATVAARFHARALTGLAWRFAMICGFTMPVLGTTIYYALTAGDYSFNATIFLASIIWNLAIINIVLAALRTNELPKIIAARKKFCSARRYFQSQLRLRTPGLKDDWFPYLLAFGLGRNVDSWFRSYGSSVAHGTIGTSSTSMKTASSSGSSAGESSWTGGGGGKFGGGGASGSWVAAAAAVGSGVSAPSSSSSSGSSSSSSGGSSGGGGGGGW